MRAQAGIRQHATPLVIDRLDLGGTVRALDRLPFTSKDHNESWLQHLIYRFPQLLPVEEIEPAFGTLVPVCIELRTRAGSIDNLYVTDTGNLAIAECKLWRNPEARRQVLVQIIDYAHSVARWSYEDLEIAIRSANRLNSESIDLGLFSLVSRQSELDEAHFIDAVARNLHLGRFLLLLVGDGIREGIESLTEYLQVHAGFHFTLAIIEIATFKMPSQGFLFQPRVLARTVNIERGIVRVPDGGVKIEQPPKALGPQITSISKDQLFEQLEKAAPQLAVALKHFEQEAGELGLFVEPARGSDDVDYTLAGFTTDGKLRTMPVNFKPDRIGKSEFSS